MFKSKRTTTTTTTTTAAAMATPHRSPSNNSATPSYPSGDEKHPHVSDRDHITINVSPVAGHGSQNGEENGYGSNQGPLEIFHNALGIPPPKPVKAVKPTKKNPNPVQPEQSRLTPANKGIYNQVLSAERSTRFKYYFCDSIVVVAMFLQIIVGASVTAFGAGSASHVLITCFGAANTALASLLAVLKSQGLPNRIRQDWNGWRELREYIEEQEREIELVVTGKVDGRIEDLRVWDKVREVEERYKGVRLTMEANRPDTYITVGGKGKA